MDDATACFSSKKIMKKLFLLDGNNIVHRAYHAIAPLTTSKGEQINAVFGAARMLLKILKKYSPEYVAVCFDYPAKTFRHKNYAQYKATRKIADEELKHQFPIVKDFVRAFNLPLIEMEGFEADDIIATFVEKFGGKTCEIIIVTGDKDALQIVGGNVKVLDELKETLYDSIKVEKRYGIPPSGLVDYFALVGDKSDNIPGVKGVGEVTALTLIKNYVTLDGIYENLGKIPEKIRERLSIQKESAYNSRFLATLNREVPLDLELEDLKRRDFDYEKLTGLLKKYEFTTLMKEVLPAVSPKAGYSKKIIFDENSLDNLLDEINRVKSASVDIETTSIDFLKAEIVGISVSTDIAQSFYIPIGHKYLGSPEQLSEELVLKKLKPLLEDEKIKKYGHNLKFDMLVLKKHGVNLKGIYFDTMIASYCLNPSRQYHGLKDVVFEVLGDRMVEIEELLGKGKSQKTMDEVSVESAADYAMADSHYVLRLAEKFSDEIDEKKLSGLFFDVEMPLLEVLSRMEEFGIKIDVEYYKELSMEVGSRISQIEREVRDIAGEEFNLNSPKQLSFVLFEKLKLPPVRKTKTGLSTDEEVLKILSTQHELPQKMLLHRELSKLKSTYIDALLPLADEKSHRIHASFNQTVTATGRLSSSDPNLQNIPVKTEEGRKIRRGFISEDGFVLLSADYSQIDLRILAHLSGDENMCDAFAKGEDIHIRTAMELFGKYDDKCSSRIYSGASPDFIRINSANKSEANRSVAKTINFGIIYGMSAYGLSQSLGIDQSMAASYIENYFSKYSGVKRWIEQNIAAARKNGYVKTLLNRIRYIPEINSSNNQIKTSAERVATNTPVQGSSADIIKLAMINIHRKLKDEGGKLKDIKMLVQVHDELLFEISQKELASTAAWIKKEMEQAIKLDIPVVVDLKCGKNWDEMKPLVL